MESFDKLCPQRNPELELETNRATCSHVARSQHKDWSKGRMAKYNVICQRTHFITMSACMRIRVRTCGGLYRVPVGFEQLGSIIGCEVGCQVPHLAAIKRPWSLASVRRLTGVPVFSAASCHPGCLHA